MLVLYPIPPEESNYITTSIKARRLTFANGVPTFFGNKAALQGQLGHKTSKQTDHYAKITSTLVHQGVQAYEARLKIVNAEALDASRTSETLDRLGDAGSKR